MGTKYPNSKLVLFIAFVERTFSFVFKEQIQKNGDTVYEYKFICFILSDIVNW